MDGTVTDQTSEAAGPSFDAGSGAGRRPAAVRLPGHRLAARGRGRRPEGADPACERWSRVRAPTTRTSTCAGWSSTPTSRRGGGPGAASWSSPRCATGLRPTPPNRHPRRRSMAGLRRVAAPAAGGRRTAVLRGPRLPRDRPGARRRRGHRALPRPPRPGRAAQRAEREEDDDERRRAGADHPGGLESARPRWTSRCRWPTGSAEPPDAGGGRVSPRSGRWPPPWSRWAR